MSDTNKSQSHSCNRATKRYTPQPHPIGSNQWGLFFIRAIRYTNVSLYEHFVIHMSEGCMII